jgi:histidine ammonia-lyase
MAALIAAHHIQPENTLSVQVLLNDEAWRAISAAHAQVNELVARPAQAIYGINTGFGALCTVPIALEQLVALQHNLLVSHAQGIGTLTPPGVHQTMMVLKVISIARGHSGVSPEVVQWMLQRLEAGTVWPVPMTGSLGASGDLAPLAHLFYPVHLPEGSFVQTPALPPLGPKEALALLNGTQYMTAMGCYVTALAEGLLWHALAIGALSLEAFSGFSQPFDPRVNGLKAHPGQQEVARIMRLHLAGSRRMDRYPNEVQDPYSFRCIPQVYGTVLETIATTQTILEREIRSVSDNPNLFPAENAVLSGGNFHGQPLANAFDALALALAQTAAMSERRTYTLLGGRRGLPHFLAREAGLESGLMILQYTAAALVNEIKHCAHPMSLDSIPSSDGQEDYVSMGANAVRRLQHQLRLVHQVLAIEAITAWRACQLTTDSPANPSYLTELMQTLITDNLTDRSFSQDATTLAQALEAHTWQQKPGFEYTI